MGRSGYTSLSIEEKRYAKLRRAFDGTIKTDDTFTVWAMSVMENSISRVKYLQKAYPHLKLIKILPNGIIIDDSKINDIVKVTVEDGKIVSSKKSDDYILFAALHPEFNC